MSRSDWYRNITWSAEIEREFFARLGRSRTQRDQYLVIQAITLAQCEPKVALRLIEHYFRTSTDHFEDGRALLAKARANIALDQVEKAVEAYKELLTLESRKSAQLSNAKIDLLYLVATTHLRNEYDFTLDMINDYSRWLRFPLEHFQYHAALALIYRDRGLNHVARQHAGKAIEHATVQYSGFWKHSTLGLVGVEEQSVIKEMKSICA